MLKAEDFNLLMGDINFLEYGGKFVKSWGDDNYHIIEIIPTAEHFRKGEMLNPVDYWVILSCVWTKDERLNEALECCGYDEENFKEITLEMVLDALHSYHGGDQITNIEGNNITKMLEWITRASYHYPHIETYEDSQLYRIWWGSSNAGGGDRREIGRATAKDTDTVIEHVKTEYLKPDTEFYDIDYQDDHHVYLMINVCKGCPNDKPDNPHCENCEQSEYIEIDRDNDTDPSFKLITGENNYTDLTE